MYKAQFKRNNPYESWTTIGHYGNEAGAISAALMYKNKGMIMVRVTDKNGGVVYSG
jgi:Zn-dependent membrane protease YugP